jgi:hypothetical protein
LEYETEDKVTSMKFARHMAQLGVSIVGEGIAERLGNLES